MPVITVAPFVLKDVSMKIGADNYEHHVSQVEFTPDMSVVTWKGLSPAASFSDTSAPVWSCTLSFAQDWTTPDSLSEYLMDHAGETVEAVFGPNGATTGDTLFTADIILAPGPIGGTVDSVAVGTVTLGVVGAPVRSTVA